MNLSVLKNCRFQKKIFFIDINDGTFIEDLQIICKDNDFICLKKIKHELNIGASVYVEGFLMPLEDVSSKYFELVASCIVVLGSSSIKYPIQPKPHSKAFLRQLPHLRLRTKLFGAVFRLRNTLTCAIHNFFQHKGFINIHTPIITTNDGEGAGSLFQVTSFNLQDLSNQKNLDFKKDFFGKPVFLAVTGQLEAEAFATALNKVYTFSPTFRAEKSNTSRHISEFWMIEAEMAFCDLSYNIVLVQKMLQYVIKFCLQKNKFDLDFFEKNIEPGLISRLNYVVNLKEFPQITYKEAMNILNKSSYDFEQKPIYGEDLSTEHEKYLTEVIFKKPIFVTNWPKNIKAFYMRNNSDNETVAAMDLLVPKVGELVGGSQREERFEVLQDKMKEMQINKIDLDWYLDLRRFGSCIHSGFGLGFERMLLYLTGLDNIRDVIAFPRSYYNIS
ncbi:MAG: asparagine--tRNA ligase [Sweet potato little leaf phytoplasma]|nr:asparagine--tRNA ligase [Sweet potato little leaf phytoplasma]MDV3160916.1 asparagine--tRNA ligase [Sweet potato little leaf phytoplasma]MDV3161812.1 asparagine--tRNA ligase [Sweet potato little leaf phytoplasma]MDV3183462.1 asparagine--tRNA ligase [Sweet potato little leaf phytoplasma]MDV3189564.1 asparagine--tRNA ligase [Sweet potato little leaf phytoplasma]